MISDYFNDSVIVERATYSGGDYGEYIVTWSTHLSLSCAIQTRTGVKSITEGKQDTLYSKRLYCSNDLDILITDRIVDSTSYYKILAINNDLRSNHMQIDIQIISSAVTI